MASCLLMSPPLPSLLGPPAAKTHGHLHSRTRSYLLVEDSLVEGQPSCKGSANYPGSEGRRVVKMAMTSYLPISVNTLFQQSGLWHVTNCAACQAQLKGRWFRHVVIPVHSFRSLHTDTQRKPDSNWRAVCMPKSAGSHYVQQIWAEGRWELAVPGRTR